MRGGRFPAVADRARRSVPPLALLLALATRVGVADVSDGTLGVCGYLLPGGPGNYSYGAKLEECNGACVPIGTCATFPSTCGALPLGSLAAGKFHGCFGKCVPLPSLCEPCAAISDGQLEPCGASCVPRGGCSLCEQDKDIFGQPINTCACRPGRYLPPGADSVLCLECGDGHQTDTLGEPGATQCLMAASGTYDHDLDATTASIDCPDGHTTNTMFLNGATSCTIVPVGDYDNDRSAKSPGVECLNGSTLNTLNQPGATECTPAPPGYYDDDGNATTPPIECPAGHTTACVLCGTAAYWTTGNPGATACIPVPPGWYDHDSRSSSGAVQCLPGGTTNTQAQPMATACILAPPGYYDEDANATTPPILCGAGFYTDTLKSIGATACTAAPPGTYDHDSASTSVPETGLGYLACADREVIRRSSVQEAMLLQVRA